MRELACAVYGSAVGAEPAEVDAEELIYDIEDVGLLFLPEKHREVDFDDGFDFRRYEGDGSAEVIARRGWSHGRFFADIGGARRGRKLRLRLARRPSCGE